MTVEQKALRIIEELIKVNEIVGDFKKAGEIIKEKYKLTNSQFAGILTVLFN